MVLNENYHDYGCDHVDANDHELQMIYFVYHLHHVHYVYGYDRGYSNGNGYDCDHVDVNDHERCFLLELF